MPHRKLEDSEFSPWRIAGLEAIFLYSYKATQVFRPPPPYDVRKRKEAQ